ncbi:hypothetical protein LLE49_19965 [Alicyclobacillus tolerans]|uniref:hypothetical protein n=1 Tax=Alicyclobacillus tolerans TaxID=90970 RepID=UPI001F2317CF|nr:hypothetical protein [Alicyclobacillus tolerans]MCF8567000.1 hypothetical protein [Alicyclobacillus tolerans]
MEDNKELETMFDVLQGQMLMNGIDEEFFKQKFEAIYGEGFINRFQEAVENGDEEFLVGLMQNLMEDNTILSLIVGMATKNLIPQVNDEE